MINFENISKQYKAKRFSMILPLLYKKEALWQLLERVAVERQLF